MLSALKTEPAAVRPLPAGWVLRSRRPEDILGFSLRGLLPDYIADPESGNCAALIVMEL